MSPSSKAQELARAHGAAEAAIDALRTRATLLSILAEANIEQGICEDVADACEVSSLDALCIASGLMSTTEVAEQCYLTKDEAEVLLRNSANRAFSMGITFGRNSVAEPVRLQTLLLSKHPSPVGPLDAEHSGRLDKHAAAEETSDSLSFDSSKLESAGIAAVPAGLAPAAAVPAECDEAAVHADNVEDDPAVVAIVDQSLALPLDAVNDNEAAAVEHALPAAASAGAAAAAPPILHVTQAPYVTVDTVVDVPEEEEEEHEEEMEVVAAPSVEAPPVAEPPVVAAPLVVAAPALPRQAEPAEKQAPLPPTPVPAPTPGVCERQSVGGGAVRPLNGHARHPTRDLENGPEDALLEEVAMLHPASDTAGQSLGTHGSSCATPSSQATPAIARASSRKHDAATKPGPAPAPAFVTPQASPAKPRHSKPASPKTPAASAPLIRTIAPSPPPTKAHRSPCPDDELGATFLKYPREMPSFMRPTTAHENRVKREVAVVEPPRVVRPSSIVKPNANFIRMTASYQAKTERDAKENESGRAQAAAHSGPRSAATKQVPFRLRTDLRNTERVELTTEELRLRAVQAKRDAELAARQAVLRKLTEHPTRTPGSGTRPASGRGPTVFKPFSLASAALHEAEVTARRTQMMKAEEEERRAREFKASPFDPARYTKLGVRQFRPHTAKPPVTQAKGPSFMTDARIGFRKEVLEGKFRDTHEAFSATKRLAEAEKQRKALEESERIRKEHAFKARPAPDFSAPFRPDATKVAATTVPRPFTLRTARNSTAEDYFNRSGVMSATSSMHSPSAMYTPHGTTSNFAASLRS